MPQTPDSTAEGPSLRDILLVLGAMFAFSMMALFTRAAAASVLGVAAWRAVFVAVVFAGMAAWREGPRSLAAPGRDTLKLGSVLGVALAVASSTFVGGYAFTTVANTIFLHNLAPVVVFPLAWWLSREEPLPSAVTGAGIALVGVALLTGVSLFQVAHFANPRFLLGDGLALASALGYGAVLVYTRLTRQAGTPILTTLTVAWGVAAVLLVGVAGVAGELWISPSAMGWTLGLAVVCTNLPFTLLNLGMRRVGAGLAAVLSLSEVVFATALGVLVFGEHLAPVGWVGGLLAALGVAYAVTTDDDAPSEAQDDLSDAVQGPRTLRAVLALVALNGGAVAALLGVSGAPELLAWAGLVTLARLGPGLAAPGMTGRLRSALSVVGGAIGAVVVVAAAARGLPQPGSGSVVVVALSVALGWGDRALSKLEPDSERDDNTSVQAGLGLAAASGAFALLGHGAAGVVAALALGAVGAGAVATTAAGLRGELLSAVAARAAHQRVEGPLVRLGRPRWLAGALAAAWVMGGVHTVPAGSVGIVERFGAPRPPVPAGLLLSAPPPIDAVTLVDVSGLQRVPLLEDGTPLLCGDQSMVTLDASVHFRVSDPAAYAYSTTDPATTMATLGRSAVLEAVAARTHDAVLTHGRGELATAVQGAAQRAADAAGLGVEVVDVAVTAAAVPPSVTAAFLDVISADEERETAINRAEAYSAKVLPEAGGAAVARRAGASAQATTTIQQAESARDHILVLSAASQGAPGLTRARLRWEALERALSVRPLVVAPSDTPIWLGDRPVQALLAPPESP